MFTFLIFTEKKTADLMMLTFLKTTIAKKEIKYWKEIHSNLFKI